MARLKIRLFGSFQIHLNEAPIAKFESNKVRALLAYLAVESQEAHSREKLATLFWPEMPAKRASSNLSQALYNLRQLLKDHQAPPFLLRSRDSIQFNHESDYWLDVEQFNQNLIRDQTLAVSDDEYHENLQSAVDLYRGDFVEGFSFDSSLVFDEWLLVQRQRYQRQVVAGLHQLAAYYAAQDELPQALTCAWQQVELDPLDERACRQLMRFLAASGQRSQALTQFKQLQVLLAEELNVPPEPETMALYNQLRSQEYSPARPKRKWDNLPAYLTPLIGRRRELAELQGQLTRPEPRLLTILGPGGSGKSCLALEAARANREHFSYGVCFVALNPLQSPDSILPAIIEALALPRSEGSDHLTQLANYLRTKHLLLVLDGFEHLLAGAGRIVQLLQQTTNIKLLVTSRMRLNLSGEQLFPLGGMHYPQHGARATDIQEADAVQLLVDGLRRTRPDYRPRPDDLGYLSQICQQVLGMPLGILLAASWGGTLEVQEIAEMVSQNLDFLTADWNDVPARQRSLRATFDYTWNLLDERQQAIFKGLSVFRGAFTRRASRAVTEASPYELRDLMDHSLLWQHSPARYEVHKLLRQYGREQLAEQADVEQAVCDRHSTYYLVQLAGLGEDLKNAKQVAALSNIEMEHENFLAAWHWAVDQGQNEWLNQALEVLSRFYELQIRYPEGKSACQIAINGLDETQKENWLLLSHLLIWASRFYRLLEHFEQAKDELERASDMIEKAESFGFDTRWERGMLLFERGEMAANRDPKVAQLEFQRSLMIFEKLGDFWQIAVVQLAIGENAAIALVGDIVAACPLLSSCYNTFKEWGDIRNMAKALYALSMINVRLGIFDQALKQIDEAVSLYQSIGDQANVAASLSGLGSIFQWTGRFSDTTDLLLRCLPIYQELDDSYQITYVHFVLSTSYLQSGDYEAARFYALKCLELARENGFQLLFIIPHITLNCLGIIEQDYAVAKEHAEKCVAGLRKLHNQVELSSALLGLWYVEYHSGNNNHSWDYFCEALQIGIEIQSAILIYTAAFEISSFFLDIGEIERAVEFIALAKCHPAMANSHWVWDVYEQPVLDAAESLPSEVVAAAQERGKTRDIWKTANELLDEFSILPLNLKKEKSTAQ